MAVTELLWISAGVVLVLAGVLTLVDPRLTNALSRHNQPRVQRLFGRLGMQISDEDMAQERKALRWVGPIGLIVIGVIWVIDSVFDI